MSKFKITTNALAMSKITDIVQSIGFDKFGGNNIPEFEFSKKGEEALREYATVIHKLLLADLNEFNEFFNAIVTNPPEDKDFTKLEGKECYQILVNFIKELPVDSIDLDLKSIKELQKQKTLAINEIKEVQLTAVKKEVTKMFEDFRKKHPNLKPEDMKEIEADIMSDY